MRGRGVRTTIRCGLACAAAAFAAPSQASITGVCPDGSVFIVQRPSSIPCRGAKRVQAHEVPPLRPELLPRPYTWEVYDKTHNPNNPYHLIDAAREVRAMRGTTLPALTPSAGNDAAAPVAAEPRDLGLTAEELRDLLFIIELSQRAVLANFVKETADGREILRVSLAHSEAFQERYQAGADGAPVLLFSAVAKREEDFHAMFSFVQGHIAFHPETSRTNQFGILEGTLGPLGSGEVLLGYVVLPEAMDLAQPIDVYWNDRLTTVQFH